MCTRWAQRLQRWDSRGRLELVPLEDPVVAERFPELEHSALREQLHVWNSSQERWLQGAAAVRYLSRLVPRLWWAVPLLMIVLFVNRLGSEK